MAGTALNVISEPPEFECAHNTVQTLIDVIACHSPRFHRIATGLLHNGADAEDAVQDALLSALRHLKQFRGQAKMSTWLTTIVINSVRMKLRKRFTSLQLARDAMDGQDLMENTVPDNRLGPEETYRNREIAETLAHAISRLSPTLRTTFQLRDVDGLSIRETANLLGVPTGTVKARLGRARMRLREMIGENTQRIR